MILFVRGGALGDFVLTLPVLHALFGTGRRVDVVCNPRFLPLVRLCGEPGRIYDIDGPAALWTFGGTPPCDYEEAVLFSEGRAAELRVPRVRVVASRPPPGTSAALHFASVWPCDPRCVLHAAPSRADRPIVLAPGASNPARSWPLARWEALRETLRARAPTVLVGGPLEPWADLRPDLDGLIGLAASAGAWLGPDSGPTHLAARLGAPTLALFGPTDAATWSPIGAGVLGMETSIEEAADLLVATRISPPIHTPPAEARLAFAGPKSRP